MRLAKLAAVSSKRSSLKIYAHQFPRRKYKLIFPNLRIRLYTRVSVCFMNLLYFGLVLDYFTFMC